MLEEGVVEPSWLCSIMMVKKKDGYNRFCVDYRKLNAITERDAYPLPCISSILELLRDAKYLFIIDIKSAYWHIPMDEQAKKFTAFVVIVPVQEEEYYEQENSTMSAFC